ncbi:Rho1 guanine nucleotide exchange factor 1 [Smittium culicis]|uniref:Rho1 guanine nucleotide exchange factor 1 n=1 Tax=Smittium culicis TaxID=133412 RepID=A0A1R1YIM1_9FUNG|nr:Rho1 guanine nucleotide exchange factor 1 [Smittium culicis]
MSKSFFKKSKHTEDYSISYNIPPQHDHSLQSFNSFNSPLNVLAPSQNVPNSPPSSHTTPIPNPNPILNQAKHHFSVNPQHSDAISTSPRYIDPYQYIPEKNLHSYHQRPSYSEPLPSQNYPQQNPDYNIYSSYGQNYRGIPRTNPTSSEVSHKYPRNLTNSQATYRGQKINSIQQIPSNISPKSNNQVIYPSRSLNQPPSQSSSTPLLSNNPNTLPLTNSRFNSYRQNRPDNATFASSDPNGLDNWYRQSSSAKKSYHELYQPTHYQTLHTDSTSKPTQLNTNPNDLLPSHNPENVTPISELDISPYPQRPIKSSLAQDRIISSQGNFNITRSSSNDFPTNTISASLRRAPKKLPQIPIKHSNISVIDHKLASSTKPATESSLSYNQSTLSSDSLGSTPSSTSQSEIPFNSYGIKNFNRYASINSKSIYQNSQISQKNQLRKSLSQNQNRSSSVWEIPTDSLYYSEISDSSNSSITEFSKLQGAESHNASTENTNIFSSNTKNISNLYMNSNSNNTKNNISTGNPKTSSEISKNDFSNMSYKPLSNSKSTNFSIKKMFSKEDLSLSSNMKNLDLSNNSFLNIKKKNFDLLKTNSDLLAAHPPTQEDKSVNIEILPCYSPSCTKYEPCYSPSCNIFSKSTKLSNEPSSKPQKLWIQGVPKSISSKLNKSETMRQELIYEVFTTEREYVHDLIVLRDIFEQGLEYGDVIPEIKRAHFIQSVFRNLDELIQINSALLQDLEIRKNKSYICDNIGDIFLNHLDKFQSYVQYSSLQPLGKHILDNELAINSKLVEYIRLAERSPECRKLPIMSFLGRPSSRLARYPLLFKAILKNTPENNKDSKDLVTATALLKSILEKINLETGKNSNKLKLIDLSEKLVCSVNIRNDLDLLNDKRILVRTGTLKRKPAGGDDVIAMLLDHVLILCKEKKLQNGQTEYFLTRNPIPLLLLTLSFSTEYDKIKPSKNLAAMNVNDGSSNNPPFSQNSNNNTNDHEKITPINTSRSNPQVSSNYQTSALERIKYTDLSDKNKNGFTLTITHLGRHGGSHLFYTTSIAERLDWVQNIEQQQKINLGKTKQLFELFKVAPSFPLANKANCASFFDNGRCVILGTDYGLYAGIVGQIDSFDRIKTFSYGKSAS